MKPKPFQRPVIEVGGGGSRRKKEWRSATAEEIKVGDIIADVGLVHSVEREHVRDPVQLIIIVTAGEIETPIRLMADIPLLIFS